MTTLKVLGTGSSGNCYLLESDGQVLILDAGISISEIKIGLDFNLRKVAGCFITHCHKDHSAGAEAVRRTGIKVIKPYEDIEKERQTFKLKGFTLMTFPVPHDGVPCRGAVIICPDGHKVLYATDYEYIPFTFRSIRLNTLLIECNYSNEVSEDLEYFSHVLKGHASLDVAKGVIDANKTDELRNVVLCHLSAENADSGKILEESKAVAGGVTTLIATKGTKITL